MVNDPSKRLQIWETLDPTLLNRIEKLNDTFSKTYAGDKSDSNLILICAPGRAEILGNHTDYNEGLTISTNISNNLLLLGRPRNDKNVSIVSLSQGQKKHTFSTASISDLEEKKSYGSEDAWTNYIKGVFWSLLKQGHIVSGIDAIIESTIPIGAGVSSSAAISLATAHVLQEAYSLNIDATSLIQTAKSAENNFVGAPCGFLDQGTIELADSSWLVMNYKKLGEMPFTWKEVAMDLQQTGSVLLIGYDPRSKHSVVEGKYALRKAACELSHVPLSETLNRKVTALGEVSVAEFEEAKSRLEKHILQLFKSNSNENVRSFLHDKHWKNLSTDEIAAVVVKWIEHIIYDDQRVQDAVVALQKKDLAGFGKLLSDSGKSAIYGYELNEDSDELTWLYETVMKNNDAWGIIGIRNMGGGFNATTLALVRIDSVDTYKTELNKAYNQKFNSSYSFLEFVPSPSAGRLSLTQ